MAYNIASTFSDKTASQGWEVQRHTLSCPQESTQTWVVRFLTLISVCLAPHTNFNLVPIIMHKGNLEVPGSEEATGQRQATMEALRVPQST